MSAAVDSPRSHWAHARQADARAPDGHDLARLRWRSRRGLLELDLVLERFWSRRGERITGADAAALGRLLALPDNDLLDLVMGRTETPEAHLRALVDTLRAA